MRKQVDAARQAWRLWNDDTRSGSLAAVVLVIVFLGPVVYQLWKFKRAANR